MYCMCSTEACCSLSLIFLFLNIKVQRLNTVHLVHICIDTDTDTKCTWLASHPHFQAEFPNPIASMSCGLDLPHDSSDRPKQTPATVSAWMDDGIIIQIQNRYDMKMPCIFKLVSRDGLPCGVAKSCTGWIWEGDFRWAEAATGKTAQRGTRMNSLSRRAD